MGSSEYFSTTGGRQKVNHFLRENVYVRVTGGIKAFNQKRYVNATHIRPAHYHEFCFHAMEVMTASLAIERGMVRTTVPSVPSQLTDHYSPVLLEALQKRKTL
jgi:hypothetical protein